jgi:hybrid cluster-associated redox disulfide protein
MATVNKDMTIQELLEVDEGIADILMSSGMHCLGCIMASGEDLAQACAAHGIDSNALIDEINEYLKNK